MTTSTFETPQTQAPTTSPGGRQCVSYAFFKVDPAFRRLRPEEQADLKLELIATIRGFNRRMLVRAAVRRAPAHDVGTHARWGASRRGGGQLGSFAGDRVGGRWWGWHAVDHAPG